MSYLILSAKQFGVWDMFGGKALVLELKFLKLYKILIVFLICIFLALSVGNVSNTPSLDFQGLVFFQIFANSAFER